ncbi:peptidoglycan-binding domain-containing protein [Actinoplanes sp. NBRC 101535]|uniref:peptidoglycan-binding domain-containing protein n=1 Tax=Actinoplanes sp. NBRC 101535 TaxID=3032196 RepID=UPI0024A41114|nr:peptidoglycan-binding domain-containing protein [Actinoplanes sp. NBRC 101535]GLY08281.1 hypothetical protein Acsp01_86600 [Actinoplanes sp. NBRC 101535]
MATVSGWSVEPWGSSKIGNFKVPTTTVVLPLRREVAALLLGFAGDFHREVEPLVEGWCWGHNPRKIAGTNVWSEHAWGGAMDLNAPEHAMGAKNTFSPSQRATIRDLQDKYSYQGKRLIRAGMDFTRPDDMHFEARGAKADLLAAVALLQAPAKVWREGERLLRLRRPPVRGADVLWLQKKIGAMAGKPDGVFGVKTESGVRWWQGRHRLVVDGRVGARTWASMLGRSVTLK